MDFPPTTPSGKTATGLPATLRRREFAVLIDGPSCWWRLFSQSLGPVRRGVAMSIPLLIGLIIGLTVGVIVAGLALMEHPRRWVVCVRLPEELHRRLSEEATDHMCSVKAEIISRLEASLGQPKVVDAPRL
jgi:hypothetical protein